VSSESKSDLHETATASFAQFVGYFLRLGSLGFGGPIALAGRMQQDLVDQRGWVRKDDYVEGLALAQLAPGPLAAQLAIYLGYIHAGVLGATAVGLAFVLPSFLMVLGLSAAYVRYGGLPWMQGMFYGIGAAVIGIIARSAFKLTKLTLGKDKLLWGIFAVLAVSTASNQPCSTHRVFTVFPLNASAIAQPRLVLPFQAGPQERSFGCFCWLESSTFSRELSPPGFRSETRLRCSLLRGHSRYSAQVAYSRSFATLPKRGSLCSAADSRLCHFCTVE